MTLDPIKVLALVHKHDVNDNDTEDNCRERQKQDSTESGIVMKTYRNEFLKTQAYACKSLLCDEQLSKKRLCFTSVLEEKCFIQGCFVVVLM